MKNAIYIILFLFISNQLLAQVQNEANSKIYDFVKKYEMYAGFSSDLGMTLNQTYKTEFSKLFSEPAKAIIIPSKEFGKSNFNNMLFYNVNQYMLNVQKRFPNGFDHKVDILSISKPQYIGDNEYWVNVEIVKYIFGLTNEKKMVREETEPLILKIHNTDVTKNKIRISKIYDPKKYVDVSGVHVGVFLNPALTSFSTGGLSFENAWSEKGKFNPLNGGIELVKYSNNPNLNFGIRIMRTAYSIDTEVSEFVQTPVSDVDRDGTSYLYNFKLSGLSESMHARFIEIPIFYKYRYEFIQNSKINHAYVNVGPSLGFKYSISDNWNAKGTSSGDYSQSLNIQDELVNIPYYNFNTDTEVELTDISRIKGFNLSAYVEAGINFVISMDKKLSCDVGIMYQKGLTNLAEGDVSDYLLSGNPRSSFNSTINSREKIKTSFLGLIFNLKFQL